MPHGTKIPTGDNKYQRSLGWGFKGLKRYPELIPVSMFLALGCAMAAGMIGYAAWQKPDVKLNKWDKTEPWEKVDPTKAQKLLTLKQKWEAIPEVEQLKKEMNKNE
jgi:hypothetical protein